MASLNCLPPTFQPRVTDHIPEIIDFIKRLIDANQAYEVDGSVYFSIDSFPEYGKLSKQKIEDLHAGARVEMYREKKTL